MEVLTRATFNAASDGDATAMLQMEKAAEEGSKDAGPILLQIIRETMAANGSDDFKANFTRVAEANPRLHEAYLNANGVRQY